MGSVVMSCSFSRCVRAANDSSCGARVMYTSPRLVSDIKTIIPNATSASYFLWLMVFSCNRHFCYTITKPINSLRD